MGWSVKLVIYQVYIGNKLNDINILWVYCKLGDFDLGFYLIFIDGNFLWLFKIGILIKKLYFCGLIWDYYGCKVFDVFMDE